MHLVNGTGNSPVSGIADPGVVKQDKSSRGSVDNQNTFRPTEGRNEQRREANRRRQRQTNQNHDLVPKPPSHSFARQSSGGGGF